MMIPVLALALLVATDGDPARPSLELSPDEERRAGIALEVVRERSYRRELRVIGEVVRSPGTTHPVRTLVEARVEELLVSPGDRVSAGQEVMILHAHDLHVLQSRLLAALQGLRLAENHLAAGRRLLEIEGIARIEVERREQEVLEARLEVQAARIELHELDLTDEEIDSLVDVDPEHDEMHPLLPLRAPVSGIVLETPIAEGTWIEPFEELLLIGDPDRLELALQLTPDAAASVRRGDVIDFRPVGKVPCECSAKVLTRVPQVDPETRTVTIRADIVERTALVLPGVFVEGVVRAGASATTRTSLPESAVARVDGADHVFVVTGERRYEPRAVELGSWSDGRYEVLSGVDAGETVVVEGVLLLKSRLVRGQEGGG